MMTAVIISVSLPLKDNKLKSGNLHLRVCMRVCICICARVRACVRACVRVFMYACVLLYSRLSSCVFAFPRAEEQAFTQVQMVKA